MVAYFLPLSLRRKLTLFMRPDVQIQQDALVCLYCGLLLGHVNPKAVRKRILRLGRPTLRERLDL